MPFSGNENGDVLQGVPVEDDPGGQDVLLGRPLQYMPLQECPLYGEVSGAGKGMRTSAVPPPIGVYYHPKHLWVSRLPGRGRGPGRDRRFRGPSDREVDRASVPAVGVPVKENGVCFLLHSGQRTVRLVSPRTG